MFPRLISFGDVGRRAQFTFVPASTEGSWFSLRCVGVFLPPRADPGLFGIDATVDPTKREAVEQLVLQIINEVKQAGVTPEELMKAKKNVAQPSSQRTHDHAGSGLRHWSNWLLTRNLNFSRDYLDAVQKVTLDDIKRVAAKYLTTENLSVVSLNPKGSLLAKAEGAKPITAAEIQNSSYQTGCEF